MFSFFARFLFIGFRLSPLLPFPSFWFLKRPAFVVSIEILVLCCLLFIKANHSFQSGISGRFSFLHCILLIQGDEREVSISSE